MGRAMTDRRFFTPDALRAQAVEVRRLLLRLENGDGEDRDLGADILLAVDAPMTVWEGGLTRMSSALPAAPPARAARAASPGPIACDKSSRKRVPNARLLRR